MTPDKRATLYKSSVLLIATGLLVYGIISPPQWLAAVLGG